MYTFDKTIKSLLAVSRGTDDLKSLKITRSLEDLNGSELSIFKGYANNLTFRSLGVNVVDDSERAGYLITAYSDSIKAEKVAEGDAPTVATIEDIMGEDLKGQRFTATIELTKELLNSQNKDKEITSAVIDAIDREITKYVIEKTLVKAQIVTAPTLGVAGLCDIEELVKTSGIYITDPTTFKAGKQLSVSGGYLFKGGKSNAVANDGQLLFTPSIENLPTDFGQKVMFGDPSQITVALYGTFISVDKFTYQKQGKLVLTIDSYAEVGLTSDKAWAVADITA